MARGRVLPHNLDAEASILGGVILRNDTLVHLESLEVDDFYDMRHKVVWQAIRNLEATAKPIDVVTLEVEIEKQGKLDAIGGVAFLGELALRVPTADNVLAYSEIVTDKHQARKLMLASNEINEKGYEDDLEIRDYLDDAEAKIFEVTQRKAKSGPEPVKSLVKKVFSSLDERFKSEGGITSCHVWRFTPVTPERTFVVNAEVFHGAPVGLLAPLVQSRWSRLFQKSVSGLGRAVEAAR